LEVYSIHTTMNTYAYNLIADIHSRVKKSMLSICQRKTNRLSHRCQRGLLPLPHISVSGHTTTGGTAASCSGITVARLIASPDQNLCPFKQTAIPGQAFVHTKTADMVMLAPKMSCTWQKYLCRFCL
jgi:glutamate/tyrosine decarboxylase-like PLP-dependent enzyme